MFSPFHPLSHGASSLYLLRGRLWLPLGFHSPWRIEDRSQIRSPFFSLLNSGYIPAGVFCRWNWQRCHATPGKIALQYASKPACESLVIKRHAAQSAPHQTLQKLSPMHYSLRSARRSPPARSDDPHDQCRLPANSASSMAMPPSRTFS
jgi:hypothetical protein